MTTTSTNISFENFLSKNPYIHGTTSVILYQLPKNDQKILSVWELAMIRLAPITGGEIHGGGLSAARSKGETCFGRISGSTYNIDRVKSFTRAMPTDKQETKEELASFIDAVSKFQITKTLLHLIRAQQFGNSLDEFFPPDVKKETIKMIQTMRNSVLNRYELVFFLLKFLKRPTGNHDFTNDSSFHVKMNKFLDEEMTEDLSQYTSLQKLPENDENITKLRQFFIELGCPLVDSACNENEGNNSISEDSINHRISYFKVDYSHYYFVLEVLKKPCKYRKTSSKAD